MALLAPLLLGLLSLAGAVGLLRRARTDSSALLLGITLLFVGVICLTLSAAAAISMAFPS